MLDTMSRSTRTTRPETRNLNSGYTIERRFEAIGDNLDNTWRGIGTLRGFTHSEAIAKLTEYGRKFGFGNVRMR